MKRRLVSIIVSFMMIFSLFKPFVSSAEETTETQQNYVVFDVEKFTLGLGYVQEPILVPIEEGESCAEVLISVLGEENLEYTGDPKSSFFLYSLRDDDDTELDGYSTGRAEEGWLGSFDYSQNSGWKYLVNNSYGTSGMGSYYPENGDVMRLRFTASKSKSSTEEDSQQYDAITSATVSTANKDKLMTALANVNSSNKNKLLSYKNIRVAYKKANDTMCSEEASQSDVDEATTELNEAVANVSSDTKATPITGIELDQPSKEMSEGETVQLNILISPTNTTDDKTVTWRTSNSSVATVDKNGLVTATGSGACKIYAYVGDYRAICTLKINKATTVTVKFDADNGEDPVEKQVIKDYEALNYTPKSPTKKGYTFVGWYKNTDDITTEYKQGTRFIQSVTYKAKWAHVTMLGAQVKSVINGNSGIRFGTNIYNDGDEIVEKGTLIIPANLLSEGEALTLDNTKAAKSMGKVNYETNKEENYVIYLGTIVNIPKAQFDRQMTAASYVTYQDKAGNEYTVYSPYTNGSVSVNDLLGKTDE